MNSVSATVNGQIVNIVEVLVDGSNINYVFVDAGRNLKVSSRIYLDNSVSATSIGTSATVAP